MAKRKRKVKQKGRYARFSGSTTRAVSRSLQVLEQEGEDRVRVKTLEIYVGPASLSNQVINGTRPGRGNPDPTVIREAKQDYYQRVHSYDEALPKTIGFTGLDCTKSNELILKYQEVLRDTPRELHINLVNNHTGRLDLFFSGTQFFFVDADLQTKKLRRSIIYPSKKRALDALKDKRVRWVEVISPRKAPQFPRIGSSNPVAPPKS